MNGYVQLRRGIIDHFKVMSSSEIKVYVGVLILANYKTAKVNITLAELADIISLDKKITLNSLHRLDKFGYVKYTPAKNQWQSNIIEIINYNGGVKKPIPTPIATPIPTPTPIPIAKDVTTSNINDLQNPKNNKEVIKNNKEVIDDFFSYFLLKTKREFRLTGANYELIQKRLSERYTLEQLKKAVDNFILDDWPERSKHLDLIYCIGKQKGKPDALEKWLNWQPKKEIHYD